MLSAQAPPLRTTSASAPAPGLRGWVTPVVLWAALGALALLAQAVIFGRWIADGHLKVGIWDSSQLSPARSVLLWTGQAGMVLLLVGCVVLVWRRCRKARGVTFDAAVLVGWGTAFWLEPAIDYRHTLVVINHGALTAPTWGEYIPGWSKETGYLHEPIVAGSMFGFSIMIVWWWLQQWVAAPLLRRKPHWGPWRLLLVLIPLGMAVDLLLQEFIVIYIFGFFAITGSPGPAFFAGHWYQMPVLVAFLDGTLWCTALTLMAHCAHRHGRDVHIFRDSEHFATRPRAGLRLLAGVGLVTALWGTWLILNHLLLTALGTGPVPADTPPYLRP